MRLLPALVATWSWAATAEAQVPGGRARYVPGHAHPITAFELGALLLVLAVILALAPRSRRPPPVGPGGWNGVDLVRLRLAIDARAAASCAGELRHLEATRGQGGADRWPALRRLVASLLRERASWLRADTDDHRPMSPPVAEAKFRALVGPSGEASGSPGNVVVVTIVVASRREIADGGARTAAGAARVLESLLERSKGDVVALEAFQSPGTEEALAGLAPIGAMQGRTFCAACERPFEDRLPACPHCLQPAV